MAGIRADGLTLTVTGTPRNVGAPAPLGYGVTTGLVLNAALTNEVASPVEEAGGIRWQCLGWSLKEGATLVTQGPGTQAVFDLTTNLTLTWNWTNEFRLTALAATNGALAADPSGWYAPGASVTLDAAALPDFAFSQWTGLVPAGRHRDLPLTLAMDRSRTVTVHFARSAGESKTGTGSGEWASDSVWTPAGMPGSNDSVCVHAANLLVADPVWAGEVTLSNAAKVVFQGWNSGLKVGNMSLLSGSQMSLPTNTFYPAAETNRLFLECANLTVFTGAFLQASTFGYRGTNGPGKGGAGVAGYGGGGGGHGGRGGNGGGTTPLAARGETNDVDLEPTLPGSGGGAPSTSPAGGAGGGVIHLFVTNHVRFDGTMAANGQTGMVAYAGGGAGGSILLVCGSLEGSTSAQFTANGGNGSTTSGRGGGGGGGRIAVWVGVDEATRRSYVELGSAGTVVEYGTYPTFAGQMKALPGSGFTNLSAEAGTIRILGTTTEWTLDVEGEPAPFGNPGPYGYGTHFRVPAAVPATNVMASPWLDEGGGLARSCTGWTLFAGDTALTSSPSSRAEFFLQTNLTLLWHWTNVYYLTAGAGAHGSLAVAVSGWYTNGFRVRVEAVPEDGYLFSQWTGDVPAAQRRDNPVDLTLDQARSVLARFSLAEGELKRASGQAVWTNDAAWSPAGMPGINDSILLNGVTNTLSEPVWVKDAVVSNGAVVLFLNSDTFLHARDVWILTNGVLRSAANPLWPSGQTNGIFVSCRNLTVNPSGLLDGLSKGWGPTNGPGVGGYAGGNDGGGGGGYGGMGGRGNNAGTGARGKVYGRDVEPVDPGSGGGQNLTRSPAGAGGGLVRLIVEDLLTLNGTVNANGQAGPGGYCAGGSGGGIFIVCGRFEGGLTGKLLAEGGAGSPSGAAGIRRAGGGGGGRIAVWQGVDESIRRAVVEGVTNHVTFGTNSHPRFTGVMSVYRGEGYPSNNASLAESGTIRIFTPPLDRGMLILIR